jgi:iron complex outermembrane receptor protein
LQFGEAQLQAEIGGFATDITDRIQSTSGLTPNTRYNTDAVTEIRGMVADVQFQLSSNWLISANYTQQKAEVEGTHRQIDATPEWFATGQLRYTSSDRRYQFNLLPRLQGRTITNGPIASVPAYNWGDWFVLNATAQYWAGEAREHRLQLRLENILDEDYSNRGLFGNLQYASAGVRGEVLPTDPEYYYPYAFQAKPRSVFFTYSYEF